MSAQYGAQTYNSWNPLKRLANRSRFDFSLQLVYGEVLDYGCADAYFGGLAANRGCSVTNYEPHISNAPKTPYLSSLDGVTSKFDFITCLEVLEHISEDKLNEFFSDVRRLLKPTGMVLISVPVMLGPPGFLKMLYYLYRRPGYTLTGAFRHFIGWMPERHHTNGNYDHDGFDYRKLRSRLEMEFRNIIEASTPFKSLPPWLNSQVFFICKDLRS